MQPVTLYQIGREFFILNQMEVNNFDQIRPLLDFSTPKNFYVIEIIQRKKDDPSNPSQKMVRTYDVASLEAFNKVEESVIKYCTLFNARAYMYLNRRNYDKIAFRMIARLSELLESGSTQVLKSVFNSVVGSNPSEKNKTWIVDIDSKDLVLVDEITDFIYHISLGINNTYLIPTVNGYHLITHPFRLDLFKEKFPEIDVHKDAPTLLYFKP